MFSKALIILTAVAVAVSQSSTSPTLTSPVPSVSLRPCISACINGAIAQNNCAGIQDFNCVCKNPQFQADACDCLGTNCPSGDLQEAIQIQKTACIAAGITPSFTTLPTPSHISLSSFPASPTGSGSPGSGPSGPSASKSPTPTALGVASSMSPSSTVNAAGTSPKTGAGAFFGAILAAVFAL